MSNLEKILEYIDKESFIYYLDKNNLIEDSFEEYSVNVVNMCRHAVAYTIKELVKYNKEDLLNYIKISTGQYKKHPHTWFSVEDEGKEKIIDITILQFEETDSIVFEYSDDYESKINYTVHSFIEDEYYDLLFDDIDFTMDYDGDLDFN